jgi:outer membrane protein TolC
VGIPALLLSKRPDVISAEMNFRNAFEMTNVARSNFYPSLTVTANGGFQSLELKDWFSANSLFASVITGLAQPIFNQRQIKTRHEVAKANQEKAYLQFEQTLLTAGKEVSDALASYENETEKLAIRTKQLESLQNAADYSDELLRYGMVNYLEVLTAKDNALNTELSTIDNRFQQLNAVISLYRALGGGY